MRPTSSSELHVIVWALILVALVLGSIGMWYSFGAPEEKAALAWRLRWYSLACWGFGAAIYGGYRALDYLSG
jgi:hypothetical protein